MWFTTRLWGIMNASTAVKSEKKEWRVLKIKYFIYYMQAISSLSRFHRWLFAVKSKHEILESWFHGKKVSKCIFNDVRNTILLTHKSLDFLLTWLEIPILIPHDLPLWCQLAIRCRGLNIKNPLHCRLEACRNSLLWTRNHDLLTIRVKIYFVVSA